SRERFHTQTDLAGLGNGPGPCGGNTMRTALFIATLAAGLIDTSTLGTKAAAADAGFVYGNCVGKNAFKLLEPMLLQGVPLNRQDVALAEFAAENLCTKEQRAAIALYMTGGLDETTVRRQIRKVLIDELASMLGVE